MEWGQLLEAGKDKETDFLLELLERNAILTTHLDVTLVKFMSDLKLTVTWEKTIRKGIDSPGKMVFQDSSFLRLFSHLIVLHFFFGLSLVVTGDLQESTVW